MNTLKELQDKALFLLQQLIQTPSFSGEEEQTALLLEQWLAQFQIKTQRTHNNVWAKNKYFDEQKPTILLNSHHDTVKPNKAYTKDPFDASIEEGKLYGLGSNDAGASLVSLMSLFVYYHQQKELNYNLVIAATGEEESSGEHGLNNLLATLPKIDFAVVGEPTLMQLAIAEKGLLVIDGYAKGIAGHAAHENTDNAIYHAIKDILWIKDYEFPKISKTLGKIKMNVTQVEAGEQHNVVPASCHFVIDVRITDQYTNQEIFNFLDKKTTSTLKARSFRHNSSSIPIAHPIVQAAIELGKSTYGSPTLSDQSVLSCPSLKLGPGDSTRSHSANEYVYVQEVKEGIAFYIELFSKIL